MADPATTVLEDGSVSTLVHFLYRSPRGLLRGEPLVEGEPTWKIACMPGLGEFSAETPMGRPVPHHRTDDPRGVVCPMCERTEEFVEAMENLERVLGRRRR